MFDIVFRRKRREKRRHHTKISLLIPFSTSNEARKRNLEWLLQYWRHELPNAEIVIGHSSTGGVFCKGEAFNDALSRATGEILVLLDADAYIEGAILEKCARKIVKHMRQGHHMWFIPYRRLYRLTEEATERVIASDPAHPYRFPSPPNPGDIMNVGHSVVYGHRYGAMCTIVPREALELLGCFDERFEGWGGEDIAFLRAMDTLWGKHKTTNNDILHLWHPSIGLTYLTRMWDGQTRANYNAGIVKKYNAAMKHPSAMRRVVDEGCEYNKQKHDGVG